MDRVTAAKVFVDVAYSLSFTATASRLDMSRAMVTRYIEAMEDWLQIRLFNRTTRKVSLSTAGQACLKDVEAWLQQAEKIALQATDNDELAGTIRIATSMSFGFSQLMKPIAAFMSLHPKVQIDIDLNDGVTGLTEQSIDLAIRLASKPDPSLIGKPISVCESVIVASPSYISQNEAINHPSDLALHACLGYKNFERHIWHLSQNDLFESVPIKCRLTANEATTLLHAALNGTGISLQPTYLANAYINSGQLIHILPEWKPNDLQVYVLYSSRKHLSPTVRSLIDYLDTYFQLPQW
ncbi:LysR family transcriptional regulator [Neptunomonas phycophila]|uniref:LysR family transcriptional regulator n=1 Tax=Neptunomonas phycophila TaxID=1572645 RepID=UPI0026E14D06|nr:LysR family transcriptional regulator [Neptunomonas phycophila]MDO6785167.1 LysR family transcriptional regulator [Neptunomonas phycophila]